MNNYINELMGVWNPDRVQVSPYPDYSEAGVDPDSLGC